MSHASGKIALPPIKPYHPTTFLERGVTVPFTTPLLGGARARPCARQSLELVIPNPSGGRGAYIMSWSSIASFCRPTLHDRVFNERITELTNVTPMTIHHVARAVAAEGLAGEEALVAAKQAVRSEQTDRTVVNYRLLMALVAQVERAFPHWAAARVAGKLGPEAQARLTVDWIAPRLNRPATWVGTALEELAAVMVGIDDGPTASFSRAPRLATTLRQVRTEIAGWSATRQRIDQESYVEMVCVVADLTLSLAQAMIARAQALSANMVELLRVWSVDPSHIVQIVARPDWLLDGWERICLIWNHASDDDSRRQALVEIVSLVPVLPKEAAGWSNEQYDLDISMRLRRMIPLNEDWRTGASVLFDLITRNEHFRAVAC